MLTRADDLARLKILDADDHAIELGSLWRDRTAVLVFVRHFGCLHCREHLAQLLSEVATVRAAGADIYVIGNGSPSFIEGFREQTGWTGPIYTDPSLAVYRAAELKRSVTSTLDPRSLGDAWKALRHGTRQGRTQGDQWQQGGTLVVAPSGDVRWHHASGRPGDNATGAQIVAALREGK
ncbi:MAG TPA: peroxiredoxin-like family protein [Kofleriaceae bacterium]